MLQVLIVYQFFQKTMQLRNEFEVQMKALRCRHEEECRKLQEELDLQKSKARISLKCYIVFHYLSLQFSLDYGTLQEERQRALLQLQWKVMGDKPQEEQEVNSKKVCLLNSLPCPSTLFSISL